MQGNISWYIIIMLPIFNCYLVLDIMITLKYTIYIFLLLNDIIMFPLKFVVEINIEHVVWTKATLKQHLSFEFQNLKAVCYFYIKSSKAQAYCDYWMGGMLQKKHLVKFCSRISRKQHGLKDQFWNSRIVIGSSKERLIRNRLIDTFNLSLLAGHLVLLVNYLGFRTSLSILMNISAFNHKQKFCTCCKVGWAWREERGGEIELGGVKLPGSRSGDPGLSKPGTQTRARR